MKNETNFQAPRVESLHTSKASDISLGSCPVGQMVNFAPKILGLFYSLVESCVGIGGESVPIAIASGTKGYDVVDEFGLFLYVGNCSKLTPIESFTVKEDRKRLERCHCLFRPVIDNVGQQVDKMKWRRDPRTHV
jgi:hypothetical protein